MGRYGARDVELFWSWICDGKVARGAADEVRVLVRVS
jgi:hypothetical protein